MLNYQEIDIKFTEILNSFTKEDLLKWIEFDRNRLAVSNLIAGKTVKVENSTLIQLRQVDEREMISSEIGESNYAMAA